MSTEKNIPEFKDFALDKVKLIKNGGLEAWGKIIERDENTTEESEFHLKKPADVHPDLSDCINKLKPILARVLHLTTFRNLTSLKDFGATNEQKELAENAYKEILNKIRISGFSLSGQDENIAIIITGTFTSDSKMVMAINSHRIKYSGTIYGFEEELEQIVDDAIHEVYHYLYEKKRAQLDLFDPSNMQKEEEGSEGNETDGDIPDDKFPEMENM